MVSVYLSSLPSCNTYHLTWVSLLRRGVCLHGCSSKVQLLLLTLDKGYLLTTAPPDLECGVAPLGPPAPAQNIIVHISKKKRLEFVVRDFIGIADFI